MRTLAAFLLGLFLTSPAWADSTIDLLGAGAALAGTEKLPMFQTANPAVTTTPNALKTFVTATGVVTSVAAGCGTTASPSPITTTGTIFAAEVPNLRAGTTYTIANADCGTLNNFSNAAAIAVTLPQAGSGGNFTNGWYNDVCSIGAGTATITPTTSTIGGVATLVLTTNKCARIVSDGTNYQVVTYGGGGGGGTPGGSPSNVQFNSAGAFGGDAGFTYTTLGQVTIAGGTITTNNKALTITQTWNNNAVTFDAPLLMNVTNTLSTGPTTSTLGSLLADFQVGGSSVVVISANGAITIAGQHVGSNVNNLMSFGGAPASSSTAGFIYSDGNVGNSLAFGGHGDLLSQPSFALGSQTISLAQNGQLIFSPNQNNALTSGSITLSVAQVNSQNVASHILGISLSATATGLAVFNTVDNIISPTNYERGVFDWTTTSGTLTIGTQGGGTFASTAAPVVVTAANSSASLNGATGANLQIGGTTELTCFSGGCRVNVNYLDFLTGGASPVLTTVGRTLQIGSAGANTAGWLSWAGEARLDADFSATSNTTLANVTGTSHSLTVNLEAARNYIFHVALLLTTGATAGGIKAAFGGTATVTNFIADGACVDSTTEIAVTRVAALATNFVANTNAGTTPKCLIDGTFEVNAAGTFTVQFAQNASSATASTVKRGSFMLVQDAP